MGRDSEVGGTDIVFYDGSCGLCHNAVKFLLTRDIDGSRFLFAPLHGETFNASFADEERKNLPDSIVIVSMDGAVRMRSSAVLYAMKRLGNFWRVLAGIALAIPAPIGDFFYDGIARIRFRLFAKPSSACPLMSSELRKRFLP